jgi:hypothetical protein
MSAVFVNSSGCLRLSVHTEMGRPSKPPSGPDLVHIVGLFALLQHPPWVHSNEREPLQALSYALSSIFL